MESLKQMMRGLAKLAPRLKGRGWNITKVHEIKHIAEDITRFGSPANTNTGPTEHHHIQHAKKPSKTVRKQRSTFAFSLANRYVDNLIIDTGCRKYECDNIDASLSVRTPFTESSEDAEPGENGVKESDRGSIRVTFCFYVPEENDSTVVCEQFWGKDRKKPMNLEVPDDVVERIGVFVNADRLQPGQSLEVEGFTEYHRDNVTFRAHPNYQSGGAWNDWIYVQWEDHGSIPARIEIFFKYNNIFYAVVHSAYAPPEPYSVLVRSCYMECMENSTQPLYQVVEGSTFRHHTFMFPRSRDPNCNVMMELIPHDLWKTKFTDMGTNHMDQFLQDLYN